MRKIDGWICGLDCKDCFDNNAPFYFCLASPLILGVSVCLFVSWVGFSFPSIMSWRWGRDPGPWLGFVSRMIDF